MKTCYNLPAAVFLFLCAPALTGQAPMSPPLLRDFTGINVKLELPYDRMKKMGHTRNFHLWADDQGQAPGNPSFCPLSGADPVPTPIRWNPSRNGNVFTRYDEFYGINPQRHLAVLHGTAPSIYGNSGLPGLWVGDLNVDEPAEDPNFPNVPVAANYSIPFRLTSPANTAIVLQLAVIATTTSASTPTDYELSNSTMTIQPGQRDGYLPLKVNSDMAAEGLEKIHFQVALSQGGVMIPKSQFYVYIEDHEQPSAAPTVYLTAPVANEGGGMYTNVCLTHAYSTNVTVSLAVQDGTAASAPVGSNCDVPAPTWPHGDFDYFFCPLQNTVTIEADKTCASYPIHIYGDIAQEAAEYFHVAPASNTAGLPAGEPAIAWINTNTPELYGKPLCPGDFLTIDDHDDPANWYDLTLRASLFAARYGAPPVAGFPTGFSAVAARYVLPPDNTGLGRASVKYIEVLNETDAAWHESDRIDRTVTKEEMENDPDYPTRYYYRPDQYAALMSAVYDGDGTNPAFNMLDANGNTVGRWGIRNLTSPEETKVVLAGTSDLRFSYLYYLKKKWDQIRGVGNYPFDVLNYHFYSTSTHPHVQFFETPANEPPTEWDKFYHGREFFGNGHGQFPESENISLKKRLEKVMNDHQTLNGGLFPGRPIWITEFGFDTGTGGAIRVPPISGVSAQTIQGQWLTRYFLEAFTVQGIQKLFMYELSDDPTLGNGLFGTSGLVKSDGSPKAGWYHIRTMKSVLDATRFSSDNNNGNARFLNEDTNQIQPPDDPRMYTYVFSDGNPARPTLALWMPYGQNETYGGSVLIRKSLLQPLTSKPTIQAIEVDEYDEDGRRTKIDPELIESYNNGGVEYWRIRGIHPGDPKIVLTETPLYLRINQPMSESDRIVQPVQNLQVQCLGCRDARLTWTIPAGERYAYYAVYYAVLDCALQTPPPFDPQTATLLIDRLPGNSTSVVLPDLQDDACYVFWVVPYASNLNGYVSQVLTYSAANMHLNVQEGRHYRLHTAAPCPPCVGGITSTSQITNVQGPVITLENLEKALVPALTSPLPDICQELQSNTVGNQFIVANGNTLRFELDLNGTKFIDAVYVFYQSGTGRMTFEYKKDCCSAYYKTSPLDLNFGDAGGTAQWLRIINSTINYERVEKLRVTIEGLPETGIALGRILFCTRPAPDECAGDVVPPDKAETVDAVSNLEVRQLDTRSAELAFDAARRAVGGTPTFPIRAYSVRYSIAVDAAGDLLQPVSFEYDGTDWGGDNEIALSPLTPNTTYYVDITPRQEAVPCVTPLPRARATFTTLAVPQPRSAARLAAEMPEWWLYPNPAHDVVTIDLNRDGYSRYRILHTNGVVVREDNFPGGARRHNVSLKDLPGGMYVLAVVGPAVPVLTKAFVVNRG